MVPNFGVTSEIPLKSLFWSKKGSVGVCRSFWPPLFWRLLWKTPPSGCVGKEVPLPVPPGAASYAGKPTHGAHKGLPRPNRPKKSPPRGKQPPCASSRASSRCLRPEQKCQSGKAKPASSKSQEHGQYPGCQKNMPQVVAFCSRGQRSLRGSEASFLRPRKNLASKS